MKYSKLFRALALAGILSLLAALIPVTPALAAEDVDVDPDEGEIGDRIHITGDGFTANDDVYIYFSSEEADEGDDIDDFDLYYRKSTSTDADGDLSRYIYVPETLDDGDDEEDVHGGTYYIFITYYDDDDIEAVTDFRVIGGVIEEIYPESGPVGTEVEIDGSYFAASEDITVYYDDEEVDIEDGDDDTDSDGEFSRTTIIIPESTAGDHTIAVEDESDHRAEIEFTVEPQMAIGATEGETDDEITVSGTGFKGEKAITVTFAAITVTTKPVTVKTDSDGSFSGFFIVPDRDPGTYEVEVSDGTNEEIVDFTILVSLSLNISPTTGGVGTTVIVTGIGFTASGIATVKYDDSVMATVPISSDRTLSTTFDVPVSIGGGHTIIVTDNTNTLTSVFTMESTAPPIPPPLKPEMGIKAESPVLFDWEDVTDASLPVTYTLQIAADEDFTSIVLEKTGLTKSKYTITAAQKLESTTEEAPYYWRIKATDAASNESEWSSPGSFHVGGFAFAIPTWLLYTLFGVGAVLLGILGFWIGRRATSSYY